MCSFSFLYTVGFFCICSQRVKAMASRVGLGTPQEYTGHEEEVEAGDSKVTGGLQ